MLTIETQIHELRAELADCFLTRRERVRARTELTLLLTRQSDVKHASDAQRDDEEAPD